jgi:lysophospholipase L1-like esterase
MGQAYRPISDIAVIGDSIASAASSGLFTISSLGFFSWARVFNGSRWDYKAAASNIAFATGGFRTHEIQATHLPQAIAANPSAVVVEGGINDFQFGRTSEGTTAILREMWASLKAANIRPIATTITPDAANVSRQAWIAATNILIRAAAAADGVPLCDWASVLESSPGVGSTTTLPDNIHPNNLGAARLGRVLAATIAGLPHEPVDLWTNTNWLTSNSAFAGSSGQPTSWGVPSVAGGATLNSKTLVASDSGNWWRLDHSTGSATGRSSISNLAANTSTVVGKTVEGIAELQVISGGLRGVQFRTVTSGGTQESYDLNGGANIETADLITSADGIIVLRTPRSVISAGTTLVWPQIQFSGSAVFQVRRAGVREI